MIDEAPTGGSGPDILSVVLLGPWLLAAAVVVPASTPAAPSPRPSIVLITLDTFRADHVGVVRGGRPLTPALDGLARSGVRYTRAVTASPLTLPAHCTLMTGVDPSVHGVHDNGASALPEDVATLASVLSPRGYATAAFVSSRVLDRRFGLDRGFDLYDDAMTAERVGEQGYPERGAEAVTDAALAWFARRPPARPFFLWVHYYDAHAPYQPPGDWTGATAAARYAGEIAHVDREISRLLAGSTGAGEVIVAAVGDHGEMLGEHGEKEHGIFLYRSALEVPLILSGPGVPSGSKMDGTVGTRALASTLLRLAGVEDASHAFGDPLPGIGGRGRVEPASRLIYSETWLPATAYGWSPLSAATDGALRLVRAPRPELYDFAKDPGEADNLYSGNAGEARRLAGWIAAKARDARTAPPPRVSPAEAAELAASLRSLGYLSGSSGRARGGTIDPKDGIGLLVSFEEARELLRDGHAREAAVRLRDLTRRSPGNVPFLTRLADAEVSSGNAEAGIAAMREALALNPELDLLHTSAAALYARTGRTADAKREYEAALALNPRSAPSWLGLARIAGVEQSPEAELAVLVRADGAGTESAAVLARLAQLELAAGRVADASRHASRATRLLPSFAEAWWVAGEAAEARDATADALAAYEKAVDLGLSDPRALLRVGKLQRAAGREEDARRSLRRAADLGGQSSVGTDARRLLSDSP